MNELLLRQVKVVDPGGEAHGTETDIRIREGRIVRLGSRQSKDGADELRVPGLHVSPGWVDLRAHFRDPGEEYKQGVTNGLDAAAAGGFTAVAVMPSTDPPVDTAASVEYLLRRAAGHPVRILPCGAITKGLKGERLSELHDMRMAGAVAFTDDLRPLEDSRSMMLALQYAEQVGGLIMAFCQDMDLLGDGQMHEGAMNARLGMKGIPALAEAVRLHRDLSLLEYTGGRLHVVTVSTAEGVAMIREAKSRKLKVTASVAAHHLLLDDGCLRGFDSNYKVMPPLRDAMHIEALREGLKDGTLDCVVSDHRPEDVEHKRLEFGRASFGIIGLETAFPALNTAMKGGMTLRAVVQRLCHAPRQVLGLEVPHIVEGGLAEMTLFDPEVSWTFTEADIVSRSHNTPFIGHPFTGRALGVITEGGMRLHMAAALSGGKQ